MRELWNRTVYWLPPAVERELAALTGVEDRCAARRAIWRALLKRWSAWALILAAIVVCCGVLFLLMNLAKHHPAWLGWMFTYPLPVALGLGALIGFGMSAMMGRALRAELRDLLNDRGVRVCRVCGYSLTGNTSGRCPECGRTRPGGTDQ